MGCDRNDGDNGSSFLALGFIRAVVPKNAVSAGGVVLSVRLEHFLAIGASQGGELVGIKAWMVWVDFQVTDGLPNLREDRSFRVFERLVLLICRGRELDFPLHLFLGVLGKRAAIDALAFRGLPQPSFHAGEGPRVLVKPHFRGRNGLYRIENELAEGIPVDVVRRDATDSRSQRQALFRIGLREL
jgi:hypothetical protein